MKLKPQILMLSCCFAVTLPLGAQTNMVSIFPNGDLSSSNNFLLVWPTTPGVRYEVFQSTNLQSWSTAPGYPAAANAPVQQMPFATLGAAGFFQVGRLDEQPPVIVSQIPPNGAFAVSQFSDLTVSLSDATGIATNSIQLIVGNLGTFTLTNAQLTISNGVLSFLNDGITPLGDYGTNVQVTLIVADTLGNIGTNTWTFTLEVQPQVATNLFVFGSPQAQGMGQRIGNIATAALAKRLGPIPLAKGNPWTLELVESNCLVLSYTNTVPNFATNTYVCNLTPATTNEIFYRKILAVSNNAVNMLLTLFTTNVPLAEIISEGSASLSSDSVIYNFDASGVLKPAFAGNATFTFPTLGIDLSGQTIFDQDGVALTLDEGYWLFTPSLQISLETHLFALQRFEVEFEGDMSAALVPELSFSGALNNDVPIELGSYDDYIFLGFVGPVPIWVDVNFDLQAQLGYNVSASATMSTGAEEDGNVTLGVQYDKDASPSVSPISTVNFPPPTIVPFTYTINGSASAYFALVPEVSARVESLAGVELNVNPKVTIDGQATYSDGQLTGANWAITADAYLTLGLSVVGVNDSDLPSLVYKQLFFRQWSSSYPPASQLTIQSQPQSENVAVGNSASFSVNAVASQPIRYQWYFNGIPLPGQTSQTLQLPSVTYGYAGNYSVRVTAGNQAVNSAPAALAIFGTAPLSTITFDDLANTAAGLSVPSGYCGFNWYNVGYLNARTNNYNPSGYPSAMQSPNNVAFNWSGTPAAMYVSTGTFDLISADLTAAWNDNLQVMVLGYRNSTMIYSNTYILSATSPTPVNFNYFGVTEVDFYSSGGTQHSGYSTSGEQFAMDNVTATTNSVIATPSSLTTFDDLTTPTPDSTVIGAYFGTIPAGYGNLNWNNFDAVDAMDFPTNSGYQPGMISPKNVAFNAGGNSASITSTTPFNFLSAYLTSAWNDNLQMEVQGYVGSTLTYDNTYTLNATSPTLITFDYLEVDEVNFISSGGTHHAAYGYYGEQFAMDNVTISTNVAVIAAQTIQTMTKAVPTQSPLGEAQ